MANKSTRRHLRRKLHQIMDSNFRLADAVTGPTSQVYKDIAFLAKIVSMLEKDMGTLGEDIELDG